MIMNDDVFEGKELFPAGIQPVRIKNIENKSTKNGKGKMWAVTLSSGNSEVTGYFLHTFPSNEGLEKQNISKICDLLFACNCYTIGASFDLDNTSALIGKEIIADIGHFEDNYNGRMIIKAEILSFFNLNGEIRPGKIKRKSAQEVAINLQDNPRSPRAFKEKITKETFSYGPSGSSNKNNDDDVPF